MKQLNLFQRQPELFTIGYGRHERAAILALLDQHGIELVIDVRRSPRSRFNPEFSKTKLIGWLGRSRYQHWPQLGNSKDAPKDEWLPEDQRAADQAMAELEDLAARPTRVALLCAESDPGGCHRSIIAGHITEHVTHLRA